LKRPGGWGEAGQPTTATGPPIRHHCERSGPRMISTPTERC